MSTFSFLLAAIRTIVTGRDYQILVTFIVVGKQQEFFFFHWRVDINKHGILFISHHSVFFLRNNKWVSRVFYWFMMFWLSSSEGDRKGNCHLGLVVENEVTGPMRNDFYLQSHAAIQGSKLYVFCLANMLTVFFSSSSFCPLHSPSRWYFQR